MQPYCRRPTAVDSRGTAPRCPQLSTVLTRRVSVRRSREDLRAPGLRCSVMACGLLNSRVARDWCVGCPIQAFRRLTAVYTLLFAVSGGCRPVSGHQPRLFRAEDWNSARAEPDCPALPRPPRRRRRILKTAERKCRCLRTPFFCVRNRAVEVFRSVQYRCMSESKDTSVRNLRGFETRGADPARPLRGARRIREGPAADLRPTASVRARCEHGAAARCQTGVNFVGSVGCSECAAGKSDSTSIAGFCSLTKSASFP